MADKEVDCVIETLGEADMEIEDDDEGDKVVV